MNPRQNSSRQPSQPVNRAHMKRPYINRSAGAGINFLRCAINQTRVSHPWRPRGSQSGREKRREESFQAQTDCPFRAEKRNEHARTFLPRSPGRVSKNGGISNNSLPKNKMFPLLTWKERAICLQTFQAVVITLSSVNFLEEYLIVKRTLTTLISSRFTGNVHA